MLPRTLLVLMIVALALPALAEESTGPGPTWQVNHRTTSYNYQSVDRVTGREPNRSPIMQTLSGSADRVFVDGLSLRGAWRYAGSDASTPYRRIEQNRFYSALIEARLTRRTRLQFGRQFLQAGVASFFLDGAALHWRASRTWRVTAWAGGAAPPALHKIAGIDSDAAAGAHAVWRPRRGWQVGLSTAYRERDDQVAARPFGVSLTSTTRRDLRWKVRATYDFEREDWTRLQLHGDWRPGPDQPAVTLQVLDRAPSIDAASWFARFTDLERIRVVRAAAHRRWPSGFGAEIEGVGSFSGDRTSRRLGLAALLPHGRVGYSVRMGDAGEESRFYGEAGLQVRERIRLEAEASLLTWALLEDAPADQERDVTTLAARVRWDLGTGWRVLAEVQSLANAIYDQDTRFLLALDIFGSTGSSRYGLGTGRSLR